MNEFSVRKKLCKNTGDKNLIYKEGKFVEVVCKDGVIERGTITKIEDTKIYLKSNICELEVEIDNLVDIVNKNPYSL